MRQVFHPYQEWEGYKNGMYEPSKLGHANRVVTAKQLLANPKKLRREMERVTLEWPVETEQVLSDPSISHRAWLGQSACNIYADVKEDETREAWGYLSEKQRREANKVADIVDKLWRERHDGKSQMTFLDLTEEWL